MTVCTTGVSRLHRLTPRAVEQPLRKQYTEQPIGISRKEIMQTLLRLHQHTAVNSFFNIVNNDILPRADT